MSDSAGTSGSPPDTGPDDPRALALAGARKLTGYGEHLDADAGIRLIVQAAQLGNAEACEVLAAYVAEGRLVPRDWMQAFDLLRRAAELGEPRSRRQLALLASDPAVAAEIASGSPAPDVWTRARDAIDLEAWLRTPAGVTISASPRILVIENFLSPPVCDWLIERARGKLAPAEIYDQTGSGQGATSDARNNSNCILHPFEWDVVVALVRARIAAAAGSIPAHLEDLSVLHYGLGQRFTRHVDFIGPDFPGFADIVARQGQRVATALVCLNEDFEGGETGFPHLGLKWKGRRGEAIFFWNIDAFGQGDPRTEHAGRPPTSGQKWILSQFIRDKPWPLGAALYA